MGERIDREQIDGSFASPNSVTFTNSWTDYDASHPGNEYGPAGYYKDAMGIVHLCGLISGGTLNTSAFTLPAGFRPAWRQIYTCLSGANGNPRRLDITADGQVIVNTSASTGWITLAGVSFVAEQ